MTINKYLRLKNMSGGMIVDKLINIPVKYPTRDTTKINRFSENKDKIMIESVRMGSSK